LKRNSYIAILLFVFLVAGFASADVDLGNARVPETAKFGGVEVAPGSYNFQLADGGDGEYIQISAKGDKVVAQQRAIVIPARTAATKPVIEITKPENRNFLRIRIRAGENWYFAYMQLKN